MTDTEHCTETYSYEDASEQSHARTPLNVLFLQWISIVTVPNTSISRAWISAACPEPTDFTSSPFTLRHAPVVISFNNSSSKLAKSTTICTLFYSRTIIQCNKVYLFATTAGTYPTFHIDHRAKIFTVQQVNNFVLRIVSILILCFQLILKNRGSPFPVYPCNVLLFSLFKDPIRSMATSCSVR